MFVFRILRTDLGLDPTTVERSALLIGRAAGNDLLINDPLVAQSHAGICWRDDVCWLSNFSATGTLLNGNAITHAHILAGDVIQLGRYILLVTWQPSALQLELITQIPAAPPVSSSAARQAVTPAIAAALQAFWQPLRLAADLDESSTENWSPNAFRDVDTNLPPARRWRATWLRIALVVVSLALLTALVFPRAYAPGALSLTHGRKAGHPLAAHAAKPIESACLSCHALNHPVQTNCVTCHTTEGFRPALAAKHEALKLQCVSCHNEHRGALAKLTAVPNATCLACHQVTATKALHGKPVGYPVNRFAVWSWDGLSQAAWQQHQLPGGTADYTLREQFHMLHAEGRAQGRTRCTDCHLGGTAGPALKLNVRESCAQCHTLAPALANEIAAQAKRAPLKQGATLCVDCHAQHGSERDALASVRRE